MLYDAAKLISVFVGADQIRLRRFETHPESFGYFHFELFQPLRNIGNSFAAPAIASERPGELSTVGSREHTESQIPDRLKRLSHDCRSPEKNPVCKEQLLIHFRHICFHHIVGTHVNIPAVTHTLSDLLGQRLSIAVSAHIRNDNRFLRIRVHHS